jgi:hypothetical protein
MIVIQNAAREAAHDEVIFSAGYSIGNVSLILITWCLSVCLFVYLWHGSAYGVAQDIYDAIADGGRDPLYLLACGSIMFLLLLPFLPIVLNPICFKKIVFYSDRVEIVRRILRSKTIYYSNARVDRGTLLPGYLIEEVREKGKPQRTPFLYDFQLLFFPSEAAKKIETILDYLTDDSTNKGTRLFKKCELPRFPSGRQPTQA